MSSSTPAKASALIRLACFFLCIGSPPFVIFYWIAYQHFEASISAAVLAIYSEGPLHFFVSKFPGFSIQASLAYAGWLVFQAVLYVSLPGRTFLGPVTPGGRRLSYRLNGLAAWIVTISIGAAGVASGILDPAFVAKNWEGLVWMTTVYCLAICVIFHIKARVAPDDEKDTFITGSFWYDFFEGGELHPRIGQWWDWRQFLSTRTGGILAWTVIDLSFAAYQYEIHGYLTKTMIATVLLRGLVVVDFFVNEDWFFHTLDGMYESFAFYNIYGFSGMMPVLWTLQSQYLAIHPREISHGALIGAVVAFIMGWCLRFSADHQKNQFRQTQGECLIWGQKPKGITATYRTADGKDRQSLLLCSGWWGVARHANYTGSMLYTWASCVLCGNGNIFAYAEAVLMTLMVIHRCFRDEEKCSTKYGEFWEEYCRRVPWRMIPGIY